MTNLRPPFPSVPLPANDHPPGLHGPWVAQGDGERVQLGSGICSTRHPTRAESGDVHGGVQYIPHIRSLNARQQVRCVSPKRHEQDGCPLCRLASLIFTNLYVFARYIR